MAKDISDIMEHDPGKINSAKENMSNSVLATYIASKAAEEIAKNKTAFSFLGFSKKSDHEIEEWKIDILNQLKKADIDLLQFDILLNNGINRNLKKNFAKNLICLTIFFTISSYLILILNSPKIWALGIPEHALTAFIIEIPIQFVGILYIIAKHLFPDHTSNKDSK